VIRAVISSNQLIHGNDEADVQHSPENGCEVAGLDLDLEQPIDFSDAETGSSL